MSLQGPLWRGVLVEYHSCTEEVPCSYVSEQGICLSFLPSYILLLLQKTYASMLHASKDYNKNTVNVVFYKQWKCIFHSSGSWEIWAQGANRFGISVEAHFSHLVSFQWGLTWRSTNQPPWALIVRIGIPITSQRLPVLILQHWGWGFSIEGLRHSKHTRIKTPGRLLYSCTETLRGAADSSLPWGAVCDQVVEGCQQPERRTCSPE